MNKVQKIREGVEKLKSQLLRGACSSQIAMETMCKEEAYNEVLAILDTMQEEPKQCMYSKDNYTEEDRKVLCEGCEEKCEFNQVKESAILQHVNETCKENSDSLTQEPVSEDLGEYINELSKQFPEVSFAKLSRIAVRVAKWQKEKEYTCYEEAFEDGAKWKVENLWKPANGDDLPEIDREVIVLIKYNTQRNIHDEEYPTYRVGFGHRPNPDGWDGKSITTGNVEHYTPKTYGKGGWNIPDVKYWLDCSMPKEIGL